MLLYNPPVVNAELGIRQSYVKAAVNLASDLVRAKVPTLVFGQSRNNVEVMLKYLRDRLADGAAHRSAEVAVRDRQLQPAGAGGKADIVAECVECALASHDRFHRAERARQPETQVACGDAPEVARGRFGDHHTGERILHAERAAAGDGAGVRLDAGSAFGQALPAETRIKAEARAKALAAWGVDPTIVAAVKARNRAPEPQRCWHRADPPGLAQVQILDAQA